MRKIELSIAEYEALVDAMGHYLNGNGMSDGDPNEAVLENLFDRL